MNADREELAARLAERITNYLASGGFFNPEAMEHDKVRDLLIDCRDYLVSLPAPVHEAVPDGWRLVPVEPTEDMILAGMSYSFGDSADNAARCYRTMLKAAPACHTTSDDACPICLEQMKPDDICATDVELGICHAACLEGSPVVDLETGEPSDGPISTFRYGDVAAPSPETRT